MRIKHRDDQGREEELTPQEFADRWEAAVKTVGHKDNPAGPHKIWLYYNVMTAIAALRAIPDDGADTVIEFVKGDWH
ncbi:hypothetical protein OLP41_gp011 [Mycobacterium phage I3]|uniref:Uncharacterized protein n=3 Tax=Bixzunavirus TaxID=680114 RepID=A0A2D1G794_9CAUD|nr:hypothetical protein KHO58_gp009 [Mycobacterium phage Bigswole]YP_010057651.1 hypothetical protein KHO61_gp011 [Mycobacterium phage Mangeria]YP_010510419.1 hypothetical protein OLP41_gp011 [Mycobacterium phage I3]ATN87689.1 hypothetical protein SEA_BIGSWOLE_9 [Mycobacterium phage Bigswole]QHB47581.1 hypothetical protein SEA_MANGERIA_11 [Mycobacterium phage Mangeria]QWT30297.1 hypothetical protein PBI_I3_11 [Mycobacterium phage I3]